MKKIALSIIFTIFCLTSCTKDSNVSQPTEPNSIGSNLLSKLSSLPSIEVQQKAYSTLKSNERLEVWKAKLQNEINSGAYKQDQIQAIEDVKKLLSISLFEDGDAKEIFQTVTFPLWEKKYKSSFSTKEIYFLFVSLSTITSHTNNLSLQTAGDESGSMDHCTCNLGSRFTCFSVSSWHNCYKYNACYVADRGCGLLGEFACDGNRCG